MQLPKDNQKYIIRLVNLQTGKFAERAIGEATLYTLRQIEATGIIQILDVIEKTLC